MSKIFAIALNTFREALRNKILYSVVLFAVVIVGVSALFGSVTIGSQINVIKDFGLFSLSFFGAIITIISGVSLLNRELKQKTVYNILSKPVQRWQFIVGKHLGLTLTVGVLITLMGFGLMCFVSLMSGKVDFLILHGVIFAILEITVVAAVCIFFSSLVVTTTLSGLFTLGTYVTGRSISYLKYFTTEGENYDPALAPIVSLLDAILPDLSLFNFSNQLVYGVTPQLSDIGIAAIYSLTYSACALACAAVIFAYRELT